LVAGRNRVPSPATGKIALRIGFMRWRRAGIRGRDLGELRRGGSFKNYLTLAQPYILRTLKGGAERRRPAGPGMARLVRFTTLAAAAAIALGAAPLLAQSRDGSWFPFKIPGLTTGSVAPAVAPQPPPGGTPEWSGQSGASGHPLMT